MQGYISRPAVSAQTSASDILGWAYAKSYALTSASYDSSGAITSATVGWPDGSNGTYTTTSKNSVFNVPDSYTVTHVNSGLTVSQPAVTRNANGDITAQPTLSIA